MAGIMIQKVFWVLCLCLQLMMIHAQLDLPNTTQQGNSKQAGVKNDNGAQNHQHHHQNIQQQPQQPPLQQPPQQPHPLNNQNFEFGRTQFPYPYNFPVNFPNRQPIQLANQKIGSNESQPGGQYNGFGRLDSTFGPGHFGHDYIGHLRQQSAPVHNFPNNFIPYPSQNLVSTPVNTATGSETAPQDPNAGRIPYPPPNFGQFAPNFGPTTQPLHPFTSHPSDYDRNVQVGPPILSQQYHPFGSGFGQFDFGQHVAPPQTVEQNIQVGGSGGQEAGPSSPSPPVVGFYGPPPNLRYFGYPGFAPGYNYQGGHHPQQGHTDPGATIVQQNPQPHEVINPK